MMKQAISRKKSKLSFSYVRDSICEGGVMLLTICSSLVVIFIFGFILLKAWQVLKVNGLDFIITKGFDTQITKAYHADAAHPYWKFGAAGLIMGSMATTIGALVIALPLGLGTAIVITELAPNWIKKLLQSVVRLLASIPSIIYGLIGLLVIVPFITRNLITVEMQVKYIKYFQIDGKSLLAGILVLSIMIVPIIINLSVDAINAVPKKYKEASMALGISHWRTIVKVIIPAAKSGILAGIILAVGRAIGEAVALSMVGGGIGNIPDPTNGFVFFLTPVLTLASAIVNKSEAMSVPTINSALFACGVALLISCVTLSVFTKVIEYIIERREGIG